MLSSDSGRSGTYRRWILALSARYDEDVVDVTNVRNGQPEKRVYSSAKYGSKAMEQLS